MTWIMWVELVLLVIITIVLAYTAARIDIALIQRRARRQSEQNRIVDVLKRK